MRKEADYRLATAGDIDSVPAVRDNQLVQDLVRKQTDLHQQLNEALSQYGPNFPKVQRLQEQVKSMDQFVASQKQDVVKRLEQDYRTAVRREEMITASLDLQKTATNQMGEKMVQYNILKRDADANKQLYDGLLEKLKEASISAGLHSSNIRVVDAAMVPSSPARPIPSRNILLAIVVGLVGGIGLAFVREYMDNTVKTPDDVEMLSHLPSLAVVPAFTALEGKRGRLSRLLKSDSNGNEDLRVELAFLFHAPVANVGSISIPAHVAATLAGRASSPGDFSDERFAPRRKNHGSRKSGGDVAQLGDNTLLVDADLRKPRSLAHDGHVGQQICRPELPSSGR